MRALGHCNRCGGHVAFAADLAAPPEDEIDPALGPHQVMGSPRLDI